MYNQNSNSSRERAPRRQPSRKKTPRGEESKIYFIALMPTAQVGKEIIRIKQAFAQDYNAVKALHTLPHITLQAPFTARPGMESALCGGLLEFAAQMRPVEVVLDGFGTVDVDRRQVLFIKVAKSEPMMGLHRQLIKFLRKEFGFSPMLAKYGFNPHISISFNDLPDGAFAMAREEYEEKEFNATFMVNNLYLFRHNGKTWEILQKCRLGG
jgi:2'-5' RNA ligase